MLQRAASNAYSWWWASHVRTKQSKWLEQNLHDMEEKVQTVLKLIEEDGDSFRKRAEMYYKKRPELIHFVEESYRAYRALAERYDHISTELQNANNTLAYVFPEQVELAMEDDEDEAPPRFPKKNTTESSKVSIPKVPKVPKDLKALFSSAPKKLQSKDQMPAETSAKTSVSKSGLSKSEGLGEIDKIQKQILGLQTEKEFARSSYEGGLAKYWEIENQIREMQDRVCTLQDEFGAGAVIEDVEARTLMASAALKSCQETLSQLEEKQKKYAEEAVVERERINKVRQKWKSLKNDISNGQIDQEKTQTGDGSMEAVEEQESSDQEASTETQMRQDLELLRQTIKAQCEVGSNASVSVTQLVEKIDALVIKVIDIEFLVSSQTALVQRLRTETDELLAQIRALEDDKATLIEGKKDMSNKLREMDERLQVIQHLNQNVEERNNNLQTHFTEARCNLDHLSQRVHTAMSDDKLKDIPQRKDSTAVPYSEQLFKGKSGSQDPHNSLAGMQNIKPEKDLKVSGSQSEDAHNELQNIKSAKEYVASGSEFDDSDKGVQNAKLEELRVSDSLCDDSDKEVQNAKLEELWVSDSLCDDTYKEAQNVKPDEELKVSGSPHGDGHKEVHNIKPEGFEASGSQRDCDSKELQNLTPANQVKALDPSQKKVESLAEVSFSTELNEEEQKLNCSSVFEKATMEKPEGTKEHEHRSSDKNHSDDASLPQTTDDTQDSEEKKERLAKSTSSRELDVSLSESPDREIEQGDEPDWKKLFMKGIENREQILLAEYTFVLRNFKEVKKKLAESKKKKGDSLLDVMIQLKDLKTANEMKDEQILYLKQKLSLLHAGLAEDNESNLSVATESSTAPVEKDINAILMDQPENMSEIERKFRMKIDEVLEENLDFWLRFSNTFHQIQKFESAVEDLRSEMMKLEEKRKQEESSSSKYYLKSDAKPLYRHLREINTELTVSLEKSMLLKDEVKSRFSSLCGIQEEITGALKDSAEDDDFKFTSYEAAKFQGEILNMKQENNKVEDELQAGLDHITTLQLDVEKSLTRLNDDFELFESKQNIQLQHSESRSRVPLRSFIFGNKPKKQKYSILSCVHPALQKKYNGFRAGMNL